jgi:hypothetical protein
MGRGTSTREDGFSRLLGARRGLADKRLSAFSRDPGEAARRLALLDWWLGDGGGILIRTEEALALPAYDALGARASEAFDQDTGCLMGLGLCSSVRGASEGDWVVVPLRHWRPHLRGALEGWRAAQAAEA